MSKIVKLRGSRVWSFIGWLLGAHVGMMTEFVVRMSGKGVGMNGGHRLDARMLDFFFFQAEDGIRDYKVTGVQTCALPICPNRFEKANCSEAGYFPGVFRNVEANADMRLRAEVVDFARLNLP